MWFIADMQTMHLKLRKSHVHEQAWQITFAFHLHGKGVGSSTVLAVTSARREHTTSEVSASDE
jgi:ATP-dependent Clp protease adapter protein ClpS